MSESKTLKFGFPYKNFFGLPKGWKDLGKMKPRHSVDKSGETIVSTTVHVFCGSAVNIGRENEELFRFCPRCLMKIQV